MAVIAESAPQPTDLSGLCLALTELAPWPMAMVEEAGHIVRYVNPAFCRLLDKPSEQLVGISFREMLPESTECAALLDRVSRTGKPESHTEQKHSKSHPVFWSFTLWPVSAGELPVGVMIQVTETGQHYENALAVNEALMLGSLRQHELTEAAELLNVQLQTEIGEREAAQEARKQAEQRQLLLTDELAHRGKNLLAVILSIASRSLSGTRPLAEARDVFIQRLHALARSQSLLIREGFEGAPLEEVVRLEFESFSDRVKAVGPHVMLNPRVAQTFALVVHELSTNATKYGALSRPNGQVAIHWAIEGVGSEAKFKFQWQELDGPPVVPPTHQGFGRILLEKAVEQEFGRPPMIRFAPKGLIYEIDAPLSVVAAATSKGGIRNS